MERGATSAPAERAVAPGVGTLPAPAFQAIDPESRRRSRFPNPVLRTHDGTAVHFYDDLLKDKTVVISFMYTHCAESCPLVSANLVQVQKGLGGRVGRDLFIYSITVDPAHDTPAVLRDYARTFAAGPGWVFLTGDPPDIAGLRRHFGDAPGADFRQSQHLNLLTYGVEPLERWGACPALANPKWIVRYLSWLDPRGERPTGGWPPGHGIPGEDTAGR
jgi:protein SCO1/2